VRSFWKREEWMSEAKILLPKEGPVKTNEGPKKSRNEKKRYLLNA
jgi:hypothetical protein